MVPRITALIAVIAATAALAPASNAQSAPVAYAYVSTPLKVDGFAVASNGRLTPLPHSPYRVGLTHMSVNKGHLFGSGEDGVHVYSYSIKSDGSLKLIQATDASSYNDCARLTATQVDRTGSTLYLTQSECTGTYYHNLQAYQIAADGTLQFLGNFPLGTSLVHPSPLYFLANNQYAYQLSCITDPSFNGYVFPWKRENNGTLAFHQLDLNYPELASNYCAAFLATDEWNHAAIELVSYVWDGVYVFNNAKLASFTADSNGDLTTTNGLDVPSVALKNGDVTAMSISPAGDLLAVGGHYGFQIFHFDGANPVRSYSRVLQPNNQFEEFGWDKSHHLYALSTDGVRLYNITVASYSEAPGSPVSIPGATSVIVVSFP